VRVEREQRFPVSAPDGFAYITDQANWPAYWPNLVRIEPGSRWGEPGDVTRMVLRVLGREVPMEMTLSRFDAPRLVEYTSTQPGLPDMQHERHFTDAGGELHYRAAVTFTPRGLYDRLIVRRAVARALKTTFANLDRAFRAGP
jgi:polyketide cyclase/dehydrase/lipid transport protein